MATPITDEERARVKELHAQGMSRNDIARVINRSGDTVSKIAREAGLSFDRSMTIAATNARQADMAAERVRLTERLLEAADQALDAIKGPVVVYSFGGRDNTFAEETLDHAPVDMINTAIRAGKTAHDAMSRIVERESGHLEEAVSFLDKLSAAIDAAHEEEHPADAAE